MGDVTKLFDRDPEATRRVTGAITPSLEGLTTAAAELTDKNGKLLGNIAKQNPAATPSSHSVVEGGLVEKAEQQEAKKGSAERAEKGVEVLEELENTAKGIQATLAPTPRASVGPGNTQTTPHE